LPIWWIEGFSGTGASGVWCACFESLGRLLSKYALSVCRDLQKAEELMVAQLRRLAAFEAKREGKQWEIGTVGTAATYLPGH
jgi:hypothetical protein